MPYSHENDAEFGFQKVIAVVWWKVNLQKLGLHLS